MPKSKKPHYTHQSSEAEESEEGDGVPITFPTVPQSWRFNLPIEPHLPSRVPSRGAMWFVYFIIALTGALVIVGCVMAAVRG